MNSNRALRATLLSVLLVLGSLTAFIVPTVGAESTSGETTLYFHQYDIELGGTIDENIPTKENDSMLPPEILDEEFVTWLVGWFFAIQMKNMMDEHMDEILNDPDLEKALNETGMTIEELLALLLEDFGFLNPYQLRETYTYTGEESTDVKGDIIFHLYFKGNIRPFLPKFNDEVALEILVNNKKIENKTVTLTNKIFGGQIQDYSITIENVDFSLEYGDELTFSVEVIPSNKTISKFIERGGILKERTFEDFIEIILNLAEKMSTKEKLPKVQNLGETLLLVFDENESIPLNMSLADFADLTNAILSSSFVFDSIDHPSSITLPSRLSGEDIRTYYLHDENQMDEERTYNDKPTGTSIREGVIKWESPELERSKILKTATAKLYIRHRNVLKKTVTVTLFNGENEIGSISKELPMNLIFIDPNEPMTFTFENIDKEIVYGNDIFMEVSVGDNSSIKPIKAEVLHDSADFLSSLTVKFEETDNIQLEYYANPSDEKIIPGGQVEYTLNVSSAYEDTIEIDALIKNQEGEWDITIESESVDTDSGDIATVKIIVKSENNKNEAYGDEIDLTFIASGKTGIDKKTASVEVSEDAIEYNIGIYGQDESKNVKKGNSGRFYFVIENKNTGAVDDEDSYTITAESKNDWDLIVTEKIPSLEIDKKTETKEIKLIVYVPKNTTLNSDVITVTVTSDSNTEAFAVINVTVNVLGSSIFESIYDFFDSVANSLGLDDMFGSKAPYALAGILAILIVLIIIILIFLLRRKSVKIVCIERIQEIDPSEEAVFDITLNNPTKKTKTYEITSKASPVSSKWQTATDVEKITIAARSSKQILLVVKPEGRVGPNDWTEVKLNVKVSGKKKSEEITAMIMVKEGKTILRIKDVFSWPKEFKKGDRITTSFKLENKGNITAKNVKVVLFINGKQKNKVEVTIPHEGFADIKIPWIALKGKNDLQLKAIEQ